MDVEASTAVRQAEVTACKRMIARVQDRFCVWPERLAADTDGCRGTLFSPRSSVLHFAPCRKTKPSSSGMDAQCR